MAQIQQSDSAAESKKGTGRRHRWRSGLLAVSVLVVAAAGWPLIPRGGNLPDPPFEGETWALVVGEESNGGTGTFKVCHGFFPPDVVQTHANGLGGAGCETSPVDAPEGAVIADVTPAVATPTGVVILVNLTITPVAEVVLTTDSGEVHRLTPFVMPQSGEQFVAAELSGAQASVKVDAVDAQGTVLESRVVSDLSVS